MQVERIFDILTRYQERWSNQEVALAGKQNGEWRKYSIKEYIELTKQISYALIELGIQPGEKVGIISGNRPEWNILDMAIMQAGAISVPIYPTISEKDYLYILNHCEAKLIVVEGADVMNKIEHIMPNLSHLKYVYTFINREKFPYLEQLVNLGKEHPHADELQARSAQVKTGDCATIIYTSGTTGTPKGVMLSHGNILGQLFNLENIPSPTSRVAFSFLPLCHAYERMLVFLYQYLGMSIYYAQNLGTIGDNIKEVNPTMMSAVPRMLEKIFDKIYSKGKSLTGVSRMIYYWAIKLAQRYKIEDSERGMWYNCKLKIADKLIYSKIRENIGGNFDIVVSGAASIQPRLASFFSAIKMPIFEGYGLTETSPVIAVSNRGKYQREAGTVGPALPGVEIKIGEKGEILCRGHNVMLGYYKEPQLTQEVIDADGWFHTGDQGKFNEHGALMITGRLKNIFKTSFGKYVNPQAIEEKFSESPFIENMVVAGENEKFATALISPDFAFLKGWCSRHNMTYTSPEDIVKNPDIIQRFQREVDKYNAFFGDYEKIKKFVLIPDEWSQLTDILTPTLKVKRNMVMKQYAEVIENMYR
ncbi:MAG: long-chain fatty acid--CoA ligase [Bacteroidales bacterium]|jgi:long-chain acyl-CoA synthetase|nr:long-chain fatty acid--CoA ligase [Bacteroidales bacterium]